MSDSVFKHRLVAPIVNINGSSADSLMEGYIEVYRLLDKAIDAALKAMPHGRDYQTAPEKYPEARAAFLERIVALSEVKSDMMSLGLAVEMQNG